MKKVLVFAMLVLAIGLHFSCTTDIESAEDILGKAESSSSDMQGISSSDTPSSSSSSLSLGSVLCLISGTCAAISAEVCSVLSGIAVQSCPESSSSFAIPSSSSVVPNGGSSSSVMLGVSSSEVTSSSGTVPSSSSTTEKSCNFGICENGSGWNCMNGGCYAINISNPETTTEAACRSKGGTVVSCCPSGTAPPNARDAECRSIVSSSSSVMPSSSSVPSSSSLALSSSVGGQGDGSCVGFVEGTEREHYGKMKKQFCDERDGKKYVYVVIGTQTWMAENLNYNASNSKCYGDNTGGDSQNMCGAYGRLYDWDTAMNNVCPTGWYLPSNAEWGVLVNYAGGSSTALKAALGYGTGTDQYGFSALPGGRCDSDYIGYYDDYHHYDYYFGWVGNDGYWWTASEDNPRMAKVRDMGPHHEGAYGNMANKDNLYSVRCIMD